LAPGMTTSSTMPVALLNFRLRLSSLTYPIYGGGCRPKLLVAQRFD
jgi:hypothetical protein